MLKLDGSRKMAGDLLPNVTNTYYCGKSTNKWVYGYFQKLNAGLTSHLEPLLNATYRLGSTTRAWKELYLNSLMTNITTRDLIPVTNLSENLGSDAKYFLHLFIRRCNLYGANALMTPKEGEIYFDTVTKKHRGYDGTVYNDFY